MKWSLAIIFVFTIPLLAFADVTATLRPISDGGNDSVNWKHTNTDPCDDTGVNCYTQVNESSGAFCTNSDGDTSYVESNTTGAQQTFDIDESSIPNNSTITQIDITVCVKKSTTGGANSFQTRRCVDASCASSGTTLTTGNNYAESTQSHTGLSITKIATTDIEIGAEIIGSVANKVRLSQISAMVTYTPPADAAGGVVTPRTPLSQGGEEAKRVAFSGKAYPGSSIVLLRRSTQDDAYQTVPLDTAVIAGNGNFEISYAAIMHGQYLFALDIKDAEGNEASLLTFDTDFSTGETFLNVKDIFVPPTLVFGNALIPEGKDVVIRGYAGPLNMVELEGAIARRIEADAKGYWSVAASTTALTRGEYYVKARQIDSLGNKSRFSSPRAFKISSLSTPRADLNNDDKIDVVDWSIFLFRWGSDDKMLKSKIDLDGNGKIDILDFSIFLKSMSI